MFLDTSGLLCFHHAAEPQHEDAVRLFSAAASRLTHNYVLAEFVALATARRLPRRPMLAFLEELESNSEVEVVFVDRLLHKTAMDMLKQRGDKNWSLCDAISFLLMTMRNLSEALSTDHHFQQRRVCPTPQTLSPPSLVPAPEAATLMHA